MTGRPRRAWRSLRRSPVFTSVAVSLLALALGAATTVFAVVNAVVHPAVPYPDPGRLYTIDAQGDGASHHVTSDEMLTALRDQPTGAGEMALEMTAPALVQSGTVAEQLRVGAVSSNFFKLLGTRPVRGRFFGSDSTHASGTPGAVVGFHFWRRVLGSPRRLTGVTITVDSATYDVIGVAAPGLTATSGTEVWLPSARGLRVAGPMTRSAAVVRLRDGVALILLQRDLHRVAAQLTALHGRGRWAMRFTARPLLDDPQHLGDSHMALMAAAIALVLVACAHLSNLVLVRGVSRQRDVAVRLAIGARRHEIVLDVLVECVIVSALGALAGMLLAVSALALVQRLMPPSVPFVGTLEASVDWRVVVFAAALAIVTALLSGVVPALRVSGVDLNMPLKNGAAGIVGRSRGRHSPLVVAEIALTLAVVVGAGLLSRASHRIRGLDYGIDYPSLIETGIYTQLGGRAVVSDPAGLFDGLITRIRAMPDVEAVAWSSFAAMGTPHITSALAGGGNRVLYQPSVQAVSSDFLATLGVLVHAGRDFLKGDEQGRGAAIVDDSAARALWGGEDPVGQRVALGEPGHATAWIPVVGVTPHVRAYGASLDFYSGRGAPAVYVVGAGVGAATSRAFLVRTRPERVTAVALSLRRLMRDAVPPAALSDVRPVREAYDAIVAAQAFLAGTFLALAGMGLLISGLGLAAILFHSVAMRQREFAVRMALGASRAHIAEEIARDAAVMVLAGMGLGAFLAMWASRLVDSLLFDLYRIDPVTLVAAELFVLAVAALAAVVPAYRASRADPVEILRVA